MEAIVVTWRELAVVLVAVVIIHAVEMLLLLRWSGTRKRAMAPGPALAPSDALVREIGDLRNQVTRLQCEVDKLRATPAALVSPYNLAIQMARQGAPAGEVARGCGISRGEAELIVALYRKLRI